MTFPAPSIFERPKSLIMIFDSSWELKYSKFSGWTQTKGAELQVLIQNATLNMLKNIRKWDFFFFSVDAGLLEVVLAVATLQTHSQLNSGPKNTIQLYIIYIIRVKPRRYCCSKSYWERTNHCVCVSVSACVCCLPLGLCAQCPSCAGNSQHLGLVWLMCSRPSRCRNPFPRCDQTARHQKPCSRNRKECVHVSVCS